MLHIFILNLQLVSKRIVDYLALVVFGELPWLLIQQKQNQQDEVAEAKLLNTCQKSQSQHLNGNYKAEQIAHLTQALDFKEWKAAHPCILRNFNTFERSARNKRVVVFLDYDGTLTPIVNDPERAFLSDKMRSTIAQTASLFPTAIISGRSLNKLTDFMQLNQLYYAGSHGMDIQGPQQTNPDTNAPCVSFQPASRFLDLMNEVNQALQQSLSKIPGASVENNKYCVSAHFRNCDPDCWSDVAREVDKIARNNPELKVTKGRKVLEIRPKIDWDKGRALLHLINALHLSQYQDEILPIYLGDDTTDEDAFRALNTLKQGFGILVSSKAKPTAARYTLNDPSEVQSFLQRLVEWGQTSDNAWIQVRSCNGWRIQSDSEEL